MIIPKKKPFLYAARTARKRVPLDVSDCENGGFAIGFDSCGGKLRSGVGTEKIHVHLPKGEVLRAVYALCNQYFLLSERGKLYNCSSRGVEESGIVFSKMPSAVQIGGEDRILLSDGTVCAELNAGGCTEKSGLLAFRKAAYAYGRLWRIVGDVTLRYSAPGDIYTVTDARGKGGRIVLPDRKGNLLDLVFVRNELYLVREYGIQKLTARGDENDFAVTDVLSCSAIVQGSAAASEQTLYWLSADGLHSFGEEKVHTCTDIYADIPQTDVKSAAADGCYYLYAAAETDGEAQPMLAVVNGSTGGVYFRNKSIESLTVCDGRVFAVIGGEGYILSGSGSFGNSASHRVWQSVPSEPFGSRALLREAEVRAKGPLMLTVRSEEGSRTVCCYGSAKKRINLAGTRFVFRILAEDCEVDSVTAIYVKGENRN